MSLRILGDSRSGNCLKVKWTCERLGIPYRWSEVDIMAGESRTPEFLSKNPAGQTPTVILPDGRALAQSNAIIVYLAQDSDLIPSDAFLRGKMFEWLFWEQYSHEPYIAVARFQATFLGKPVSEIEPRLIERGKAALARMQLALEGAEWLVGGRLSLADIALVAYTRWAHEGGFDLAAYPAVSAWVARVESELRLR